MELPLIKKITNQFLLVQKNFRNINRNSSIFNRFKIDFPNKSKYSKTNIINSTILDEKKNNYKFANTTRNNNLNNISEYKNKNSNIYLTKINNRSNSYYYSTFSPTKNLTKNKFTNKAFSKYNNSPLKSMSNSSNVYDSYTERRIINSYKTNQKIKIQKIKKYTKIDKILTKYKLMKILEDSTKNSCSVEEIKNNLFYKKHKNKLFNDNFIKHQINQHRKFIFDKNESPINKLNNYLINIENSKNNKRKISPEDIFKSLNKKDINIIKSDISYFKNVNRNIIKGLMNKKSELKQLGLVEVLNKEDEKDKKNINFINKKKKERKIIKNKDNENNKNVTNYERYINKIIYNDLSKRLHQIKSLNKNEGITKIINDFPSKININKGKLNSVKNKNIEKTFFRYYYYNINDDMTKEYSIDKNRKRLLDEKDSHYQNLKILENENYEKEIIKNYTKKIKKNLSLLIY